MVNWRKHSPVHKIIQNLDRDMGIYGFGEAFRRTIIPYCKIRQLIMSEDVKTTLSNKPVLVVSTHPNVLEIATVYACLPKRDDINIVANSQLLGIVPNQDKYIIPVFIQNKLSETKKRDYKQWMLNRIRKVKKLSPEEEKILNRKNIKRAAVALDNGGLTMICPEGEGGQWQAGVGHIANQVTNPETAWLVMAWVRGSGKWEMGRLIPGMAKWYPKLSVEFSEPVRLAEIIREDPKETMMEIKRRYEVETGK